VSQLLTTRDIQRKEEEIIAKMQRGPEKMKPIARDPVALLKEVKRAPELKDKGIALNEAQERVFLRLWGTGTRSKH